MKQGASGEYGISADYCSVRHTVRPIPEIAKLSNATPHITTISSTDLSTDSFLLTVMATHLRDGNTDSLINAVTFDYSNFPIIVKMRRAAA